MLNIFVLVTEHYQGNRYRNQMIREDFPTALSEQQKEAETAQSQAMRYHKMLIEQQEADALLARELEEKMRRDADAERVRRRIAAENDIAPLAATVNELPVPPKKSGGGATKKIPPIAVAIGGQHQQQQHHHLNYTTLDFNGAASAAAPPPKDHKVVINVQRTNYTEIQPTRVAVESKYEQINLQSHTPEKKNFDPFIKDVIAARSKYDFPPPLDSPHSPTTPSSSGAQRSLYVNCGDSDGLIAWPTNQLSSPVHRSQPPPPLHAKSSAISPTTIVAGHGRQRSSGGAGNEDIDATFQMLSLENYDRIMGNSSGSNADVMSSRGSSAAASPRGAGGNVDRIQTMHELGMAPDEILEIDRRLTQQERDEEFARKLQQQESRSMTVEEQDRLFAMEAQDKELARMLQERERAKSKRAKERARIRKQQQKQEEEEQMAGGGGHDAEESSYSDPVDLLATAGDGGGDGSRNRHQHQQHRKPGSPGGCSDQYESPLDLIDEQNYSTPIDLIRHQQQHQYPIQRPNQLDIQRTHRTAR